MAFMSFHEKVSTKWLPSCQSFRRSPEDVGGQAHPPERPENPLLILFQSTWLAEALLSGRCVLLVLHEIGFISVLK
ncbi:hypothetical protein SLEP1_g14050 [Rubroshorea leprosula]|uniref:Uncharacterized protein n=1 Tax=Rubroshorea leprosula TaxID=152421 RepID=A0AAV5IRM6_9ROSI|nr:hypothetical protein SLEP1_g14050 [Rubroshorea leprosula]